MKIKTVLRYDPSNRLLRLARLMWQRGSVGNGGYSAKLSVGLRPALFAFHRDWDGWRIIVAGIRVHFQKSFGGVFV